MTLFFYRSQFFMDE